MNDALPNPALIEAVQKAAQSIGIQQLAAEMDMRPSSLYNALNPYADRSMVKLGLETAAYIIRRTGDVSPLEMIARDLGYTLRKVDETAPDKATIEQECCDDFEALAEFSRLARCISHPMPKPLDIINLAAKAKDEIDQTAHLWLSKWKDRQ